MDASSPPVLKLAASSAASSAIEIGSDMTGHEVLTNLHSIHGTAYVEGVSVMDSQRTTNQIKNETFPCPKYRSKN